MTPIAIITAAVVGVIVAGLICHALMERRDPR